MEFKELYKIAKSTLNPRELGGYMKKYIIILISFMSILLFSIGCSNDNKNIDEVSCYDIDSIAITEAKRITSKHNYSLKSNTLTEDNILIGDSVVFDMIKEISISAGYNKDDLDNMSKNRVIVSYELNEVSKKDEPIMLCMVIDNDKVIGAYLDYISYDDSIKPIDFVDYIK